MKTCAKCNKSKAPDEFDKHKNMADGRLSQCKLCLRAYKARYDRSEIGVITKMCGAQRRASKDRGHPMPSYNKVKLTEWLYRNGFYAMWCQWHWSGCAKNIKPSCDRINSQFPYALENLRLVTWADNDRAGHDDRMNATGSCSNVCNAVEQIDPLTGDVIAVFVSYREAERVTGVNNANICSSINRNHKAGGFNWRAS